MTVAVVVVFNGFFVHSPAHSSRTNLTQKLLTREYSQSMSDHCSLWVSTLMDKISRQVRPVRKVLLSNGPTEKNAVGSIYTESTRRDLRLTYRPALFSKHFIPGFFFIFHYLIVRKMKLPYYLFRYVLHCHC